MSERLEKAQRFVDRAVGLDGTSNETRIGMLLLAVDQLITEIRELRIEVGK